MDGLPSGGNFLVRAYGSPMGYVDIPHTCDPDDPANLPGKIKAQFEIGGVELPAAVEKNDGTADDTTVCQQPIKDFQVVYEPQITTEQKEEWNGELYVRVNEDINLRQTTDEGNPVTFKTVWGDGTDDEETPNGKKTLVYGVYSYPYCKFNIISDRRERSRISDVYAQVRVSGHIHDEFNGGEPSQRRGVRRRGLRAPPGEDGHRIQGCGRLDAPVR